MAEFFRMHAASAGQRTEIAGIVIKVLHRNLRLDYLETAVGFNALDPAAPAIAGKT